MDTLFLITHLANFSTSIQALTLVFHVQSQFDSLSSRFYRALYETLFDVELHDSSKIAMYLNLLHKAIDADSSIERVGAFLRRIVQACNEGRVPFICGGLFLVGQVLQGRKELMAMLKIDEESIRIDDCEKPEETVNSVTYDWKKREPEFTNALKTLMWELIPFCYHFHPTVALYARSIVALEKIPVPQDSKNYDPILNHTLTRFLERFVYKAPKKVKTLNHGSSVMQPRSIPGSGRLLTGGRKKHNVLLNDGEEAELNLDDIPVNASNWSDQAKVPVDEVTIFNSSYFITIISKARAKRKSSIPRKMIKKKTMILILVKRKHGMLCSRAYRKETMMI